MKRLLLFLLLATPAFPAQGFFFLINDWNASANTVDLANNVDWTWMSWAWRDDMTGAGNNYSMVFAHTTLTGPSYSCSQIFMGWSTSSAQKFAVNVPIDGGVGDHNVLLSSTSYIGDTGVHHVAITHTSLNAWTLYIDGVVESTSSTGFSTDPGCQITAGGTGVSCGVTISGVDRYCYLADTVECLCVIPLTDIQAAARGTRPNMQSYAPVAWWPWDDEWSSSYPPVQDSPDLSSFGPNMTAPATAVYNQKNAGHCPCGPADGEATR